MAKPVISPEEFIAEVNKRLPKHAEFKSGMRVFLVPNGADGKSASGYGFEPRDRVTTGVVAAVADQVASEFVVDPTISRDAHP
ncbi:hypothetical protein [Burkholderia pyrrocinia]|uniref:hypothetical protein n=1 Tax=Burkholderia pyrrocinia TaxID=60550 RepID=UPI00158A1A9E|nr:hypothetical protein [Burkholderia pyrrocinia]